MKSAVLVRFDTLDEHCICEHQWQEEGKIPKTSTIWQMVKLVFRFLLKNLLPIGMVIVVLVGTIYPSLGARLYDPIAVYVSVIGIFTLSGLFMRTNEIRSITKSYLAFIWMLISILLVTGLVGAKLTDLLPFGQLKEEREANFSNTSTHEKYASCGAFGPEEFRIGFQIFFLVPCGTTTSVVMATEAGGNHALAVIIAVICNIIGIFTTPFLLKWIISFAGVIHFDVKMLLLKMCLLIFLPVMIGKCFRCIPPVKNFVKQYKIKIKTFITLLILVIIWTKLSFASKAGNFKAVPIVSVALLLCWAVTVHVIFLSINRVACLILRLSTQDTRCVVILASQKTIAISLTVAEFFPRHLGDSGLLIFPMILSYITLMVFDTVLITIWGKSNSKESKDHILSEMPLTEIASSVSEDSSDHWSGLEDFNYDGKETNV